MNLLGNKGEWHEVKAGSEGEENKDITNPVHSEPSDVEVQKPLMEDIPEVTVTPDTPPAPIPQRLPDGLDPPELNTGRGF